jgi:hypothetical protein
MGVPGFFCWLVQRYPLILRDASDPSHPRVTNLDPGLNGILDSALKMTGFSGATVTEDCMSEVRRDVDRLVQLTRPPSDLTFTAVDGPAPASKMLQQRSRGFISARDCLPGSFGRTVLSPGTQFMSDVNDSLLEFLGEKKRRDAAWRSPSLVYSSCFVPGEGEHKIPDPIRAGHVRPDWAPSQGAAIVATAEGRRSPGRQGGSRTRRTSEWTVARDSATSPPRGPSPPGSCAAAATPRPARPPEYCPGLEEVASRRLRARASVRRAARGPSPRSRRA